MSAKTERFFDAENQRLVYLRANASSEFWDEHWNEQDKPRLLLNPPKHRYICGLTKRYVPVGSAVLEGGCGLGDKVRALQANGYSAVGVDFAKETVSWLHQNLPQLNIVEGNVMDLDFEDDSFDGYWSLGVIEHFYDGYDPIIAEAHRVLRPGGVMFLTFPAMNGVRARKASAGLYAEWVESEERLSRFYQFALDPQRVSEVCKRHGMDLVERRGIGSFKGIEEEYNEPRWLELIRKLPFGGGVKLGVMFDALAGQRYGHSCLLVLRNT